MNDDFGKRLTYLTVNEMTKKTTDISGCFSQLVLWGVFGYLLIKFLFFY